MRMNPWSRPVLMSNSEQYSSPENTKLKVCFDRRALQMPMFSRSRLASALSLLLTIALVTYTVPAPLLAQLPSMPAVPKPPAMPQAPAAPAIPGQSPEAPQSNAPAQLSDDQAPFHITTIEGEGAINNIHQQVNRPAVVVIEDENKTPLSGVAVSFFLPNDGPSGVFPNGSRVLTVFTDEKGVAMSRAVRFNQLVGIMPIRVSATLFSQTVSSTITQTNVGSGQAMRSYVSPVTRNQESHGGGLHVSKKTVIIIAAVGAAAAAGVYFATKKSAPAATIGSAPTVGTITIGGH